MSKHHRISFNIRLLEDCHSGSGLGLKGIIDDMHARDNSNRPVVWGTTIKGILRNTAEELNAYGYPLATESRIIKLFGTEGDSSRSNLFFSGLHFLKEDNSFTINFSTSREIHSRKPLNNTLRCIEMLAAGQKASCEAQFIGDADDVEFIKILLKRFVAIGGGRNRGKGRIEVSNITESKIVPLKNSSKHWNNLRLKLETVAPLCLPKASVAGNIIDSESYISASKLKGAILSAASFIASDKKQVFTQSVLKHKLSFGNAYPVCDTTASNYWKQVDIIPVPLSMGARKSSNSVEKSDYPWWANENRSAKIIPLKNESLSDKCLYEDYEFPRNDNYKRIKEEAYFAISEEKSFYSKYIPDMISMLRNRTPVCRVNRNKDLRRINDDNLLNDEGSLFSTICLAENQTFICDIYSDSRDSDSLVDVVDYLKNNSLWLHVGRGGQPVRIVDYSTDPVKASIKKSANRLIITMTSDLIMRDEALNFIEKPTREDFEKMIGLDLNALKVKSFTETVSIVGFNSSAKVRIPERLALKKGSVFVFTGEDKQLSALFNKLCEIKQNLKGLGEYTDDGFGRFVINNPIHMGKDSFKTVKDGCVPLENTEDNDELLLNEAFRIVEEKKDRLIKGKSCPTATQWHFFKEKIEACKNTKDLEQFKGLISERSNKLGGKCWKKPLNEARLFEVGNMDNRIIMLSFIARICCTKTNREGDK